MKRALAKMLGIFIVIVLSMQNSLVYALTETQKLEQQQDEINEQIEDALKKQEQLEKQKSEAMKAVEELIGKVSSAEDEVEKLENQKKELQEQIDSKQKDIEQKEEEYIEQNELLDQRLIAMYESGETSYLEVLLTSASMTDFLAKYYAATELIEYDKELMRVTQEQKAQIETEKKELENNKTELESLKAEAEKKSAELKKMQKEKQRYADQLTDDEKKIQKEIEELEKEEKKIQRAIKEAEEKYRQQLEALKNASSNSSASGSGFFMTPVSGGYISARAYYSYEKFHGALDYAVSVGTPVYAAADGVVMTTENLSGSYGTYVVIRHANGLQSYYAHGKKGSIVVSPGQTVKKGQKIMLSGNTGNSQGPHLHFEVRKSPYNYSYKAKAYGQDSRVNPENYL